jgi:hypothetical protein
MASLRINVAARPGASVSAPSGRASGRLPAMAFGRRFSMLPAAIDHASALGALTGRKSMNLRPVLPQKGAVVGR